MAVVAVGSMKQATALELSAPKQRSGKVCQVPAPALQMHGVVLRAWHAPSRCPLEYAASGHSAVSRDRYHRPTTMSAAEACRLSMVLLSLVCRGCCKVMAQ